VSNIDTSRIRELASLEARLGYEFRDKALLDQALTHKSHTRAHNERLEFLGDAILGYVIADVLYVDHQTLAEDALTIFRADLVRGATLGELALNLGLGEFLRLGAGERKSGGRQRTSILADAVEAIIGAVSLDGGIEAARRMVLKFYSVRLADLRSKPLSVVKDAKTQLQEFLQGRSMPLPVYEIVATRGSEHQRTFEVACRVDSLSLTTSGQGHSRRSAEKSAAQVMLEQVRSTEED
jgi:ribonuclease-3